MVSVDGSHHGPPEGEGVVTLTERLPTNDGSFAPSCADGTLVNQMEISCRSDSAHASCSTAADNCDSPPAGPPPPLPVTSPPISPPVQVLKETGKQRRASQPPPVPARVTATVSVTEEAVTRKVKRRVRRMSSPQQSR
ncbi:uncharacterized protein LOC131845286 [Achroia grisella]|uniref:uncharacterized protein LOC131845286 n=1 Tax=Achroia grisella TaxID=688607 RepID=UPI0027D23B48|nr:uncharacterized protein LOC131845286 [Achroia grisella]